MNLDNERKEFEDWAEKETNWDLYWSENINQYMDHQTNGAWLAWLASANREGYKLVPVDSLKEIIDCAYCHIHDRCIGDEGDDVIKHILAMGVEDDH